MNLHAILKLAEENGGILTSRLADQKGVSRSMLSYLVSKGRLCHSERGIYTLPDALEDSFFNGCNRYHRGVFSHGTALYLFGLTDRTPYQLEMTFPQSYNATRARRNGILCHRVSYPVFETGKTSVETPFGNIVSAYSPERTICDMFKATHFSPSDEEIGALKRFLEQSPNNASDVLAMARILKIERTMRPYLEALS